MSGRFELHVRHSAAEFALDVDVASDARVLGLFGPSGAGKTTLVEIVAGWRRPSAGRVRVGERTWFDSERGVDVAPRHRRAGYVPQEQLLFEHWNVMENVRCGSRRARDAANARTTFDRAVDVLDIASLLDRSVRTLSGGERQRVALARALCSDPDLLLLDEPFGGIDHALRRRILPFLLRLREAFAIPILFVSHDPTEVQALCDAVVLLDAGRSIAVGPTTQTLLHRASTSPHADNVLRGTIVAGADGARRVRLESGVEIHVARSALPPGARTSLAIAADQIIVATEPPPRTSARNHLVGRLHALRALEHHVLLETTIPGATSPTTLHVSISPESARDLALAPGREIHLVFKSTACRLLEDDDSGSSRLQP